MSCQQGTKSIFRIKPEHYVCLRDMTCFSTLLPPVSSCSPWSSCRALTITLWQWERAQDCLRIRFVNLCRLWFCLTLKIDQICPVFAIVNSVVDGFSSPPVEICETSVGLRGRPVIRILLFRCTNMVTCGIYSARLRAACHCPGEDCGQSHIRLWSVVHERVVR